MSPEQLLAPLSPAGRELLVRIGRRFAARAVLHQARHTLAALERHGPTLVEFCFSLAEGERLAQAFAVATALAERRPEDPPETTDAAYLLALGQAKSARSRARSVLLSNYRGLRLFADAGPGQATLAAMREVLAATSGPGGDERVYAAELAQLLTVLERPELVEATAAAGGAQARAALEFGLAQLRAQELEPDAPSPGGDAQAQRDAIDGMIVELARTASFAAKVAANELGERGLAKAFRLRFMS